VSKHQQTDDFSDPIADQIRRLSRLKGYPRDSEKLRDMHGNSVPGDVELIRVARKFSGNSELLVKRAVERVLEEWDSCPMPSQFRRLLEDGSPVGRQANDNMTKWRAEFRQEVRRAITQLQLLGDCRARRDWEDYLKYAMDQHPDIVREECANLRYDPSDLKLWDDTAAIVSPLAALSGKATDEQIARLRRQGIRDALQAVGGDNPDDASRKFWADHLAWAESEHLAEVEQLRGEPS
jgi:hypothetical protein